MNDIPVGTHHFKLAPFGKITGTPGYAKIMKQQLIKGSNSASPIPDQIGAILNTTAQTFTNPQMEATLWNYLMFRQTPLPLGSTDMVVFIRKDIVQLYHYIQYQPPQSTDEPPSDIVNLPPPTDGQY